MYVGLLDTLYFICMLSIDSEALDGLSERRMSLRSFSQRLSSSDMNQSMYSTSSAASTASVPREYPYSCYISVSFRDMSNIVTSYKSR